MRKKYYDLYKQLGICTSCGKQKAVDGKVFCWDCLEKSSNRSRNYDKERKRIYNKRKRDLCHAFKVCTTCMQRDMYKGNQCIECYLKRKRKYKEKQSLSDKPPRNLWSEFNLCAICGEPVTDNSKLCKKHLLICRNNAAIARSHINYKNHTWKQIQDMEVKTIKSKYGQRGK